MENNLDSTVSSASSQAPVVPPKKDHKKWILLAVGVVIVVFIFTIYTNEIKYSTYATLAKVGIKSNSTNKYLQ